MVKFTILNWHILLYNMIGTRTLAQPPTMDIFFDILLIKSISHFHLAVDDKKIF